MTLEQLKEKISLVESEKDAIFICASFLARQSEKIGHCYSRQFRYEMDKFFEIDTEFDTE